MPIYRNIRYTTKPDILGGGTTFHYEVTPFGSASFEVIVATDEQNLPPRLPSNTPEARAFFLFPAFRRRLELFLEEFDPGASRRKNQSLIFKIDVEQLRGLFSGVKISPLEKIKTFVFIANQNIFADPDVPLSVHLLASEIGLAQGMVRQLVAGDRSGNLELVQNDFIRAKRPIDL